MRLLIVGGIIFAIGVLAGARTADPEINRVASPPKIIHEVEPAPPAQPFMPESCRQVVELAEDINRAATKLDSYTVRQLDIFEDARIALNGGPGATVKVEEEQRDLQAESAGSVLALAELQLKMKNLKADCIKDSE